MLELALITGIAGLGFMFGVRSRTGTWAFRNRDLIIGGTGAVACISFFVIYLMTR